MDQQATINTMEVLETRPLSDLLSEVIIKVCYVSDNPNRNKTVINKAVGNEIAATLPGAPVVGFFDKESGDFVEHSRSIAIKDGEIVFEELTRPYGFVDPNSRPWYQDFDEEGEIRTYLMCRAFLWTRQYEEATLAVGKGQSMELDEKRMAGYYQGDVFVFTSAVLDKLCILGDAYEPCFSGANILASYCLEYESMAEKLEKTLGRRYYVMNGQLQPKTNEPKEPQKTYTLEYALSLDWDLREAVLKQMQERGALDTYGLEGIFIEKGTMFAILKNIATQELVRVNVDITDKDTVILGSDMTAVQRVWMDKADDPNAAAIEPINGDSSMVAASAASGTYATVVAEPTATPEPVAAEPVAAPVEPVNNAPAAGETVSVSEFKAFVENAKTQMEAMQAQIAEYKAAEKARDEAEKEAHIATYSAMLTQEEMAPILEKKAEYSANALEAQFAVLYARKSQTAMKSGNSVQVDVNAFSANPNANVPSFLQDALEFDKKNQMGFSL